MTKQIYNPKCPHPNCGWVTEYVTDSGDSGGVYVPLSPGGEPVHFGQKIGGFLSTLFGGKDKAKLDEARAWKVILCPNCKQRYEYNLRSAETRLP